MGGGQALFVWLVDTWGEGGGQVAIIVSYFNLFFSVRKLLELLLSSSVTSSMSFLQQLSKAFWWFSVAALQIWWTPSDRAWKTSARMLRILNSIKLRLASQFSIVDKELRSFVRQRKYVFYCGFLNSGAFSGQSDAETG